MYVDWYFSVLGSGTEAHPNSKNNVNNRNFTQILMTELQQEQIKWYCTWDEIHNTCDDLTDKIKSNFTLDDDFIVVGIGQGGLIPATIIAKALNIKTLVNFGIATRWDQDNKIRNYPNVYQDWHFENPDKFIIIDDILDTGNTFSFVDMLIKKAYIPDESVIYGTLHYKPTNKFTPNNYVYSVECGSEWIVYPWEQDRTQ